MEKPTIIIEIRHGLLRAVHSTEPLFYYVIDWDNIREGDEFPKPIDFNTNEYVIPNDTPTDIIEYLKFLDK